LVLALGFVVLDAYVLDDSPESSVITDVVAVEEAAIFDREITQTSADEKSIAVLPLVNLSSDPEQEYFSDGLSEELINKLSQIRELQVTGRNSSFSFKGRDTELRDIGTTLGVASILQGSVRKSGDQLRITVQLMDASEGFNLWSQTYDRQMTDIFVIQDEIATAVATALSVSLGAGEFDRPGMTRDVQAYELSLIALGQMNELTPAAIRAAIANAERAVTLDPGYAEGWNMLSQFYSLGRRFLPVSEQLVDTVAKEANAREQAELLAPDNLQVRLGNASALRRSTDWLGANTVYEELLADASNSSAEFNNAYASFLSNTGRSLEALTFAQRAKRLDPLEPNYSAGLINNLAQLDRVDDAAEEAAYGMSLGGLEAPINASLSILYMEHGNWDAARAASAYIIANKDLQLHLLPYLEAGDYQTGLQEIRRYLGSDEVIPTNYRHMEAFAALMGDPALALEMMQSTQRLPAGDIWRNLYSPVRKLPGFKQLVIDMGMANLWRTTGNWPDKCRPLPNSDTDFECF